MPANNLGLGGVSPGGSPGHTPQSRPVSHIPWPINLFREAQKRNTISILPQMQGSKSPAHSYI